MRFLVYTKNSIFVMRITVVYFVMYITKISVSLHSD